MKALNYATTVTTPAYIRIRSSIQPWIHWGRHSFAKGPMSVRAPQEELDANVLDVCSGHSRDLNDVSASSALTPKAAQTQTFESGSEGPGADMGFQMS